MINHNFIGFVSQNIAYKDNDAIISVLTKDGKKTFTAKGIQKITSKNAPNCRYFMISEFITQSKSEQSNQTLKNACCLKIYKRPFDDLLVSTSFLFIASLLDKLSDSINGYDIAIFCFEKLDEGIYPLIVLNHFLKILTAGLGYQSNLSGCVSCGKKNHLISFDFESGGFICNECFDSTRHKKINSSLLNEIYSFLKSDELYILSNDDALSIFKMYCSFYVDVLNLFEKNFDFVLKCI